MKTLYNKHHMFFHSCNQQSLMLILIKFITVILLNLTHCMSNAYLRLQNKCCFWNLGLFRGLLMLLPYELFIMTCRLILHCGHCWLSFFGLLGIDASAQTGSHEMTIPNDVSTLKSLFLSLLPVKFEACLHTINSNKRTKKS